MRILIFAVFLTTLFAQDNISQEKISSWIKNLGSDNFKERELATKELIKVGEKALPQLREAEKSDDAEVSWRSKKIIKNIVQADNTNKKNNNKKTKPPKKLEPFIKEFTKEFNGPGFHFKFKFSGKIDDLFKEENFGKFFKKEYIPKDMFEDMKDFEKQWKDMLSPKYQKNIEKRFERLFSKRNKRWRKRLFPQPKKKVFSSNTVYGLTLKKADPAIQEQLQLEKQGLLITAIASEGILTNIGLQQWDLILSVGDTIIREQRDLKKAITQIKNQETITIIRRGKKQNIIFRK